MTIAPCQTPRAPEQTAGHEKSISLHGIALLIINSVIVFAIYRVFQTQAYAPLAPIRNLLPWALALNLASAAMIHLFRLRASWSRPAAWLVMLDLVASLLPLALIRCLALSNPDAIINRFGLVYATFIFSKALLLVCYALANTHAVSKRSTRIWVFATSFMVYAGITPWAALTASPNGDEPAYLVLTHSLVDDHDFDVSNNYRRTDHKRIMPPEIPGSVLGYPLAARNRDMVHAVGQDRHTIPIYDKELLRHDIGMPLLLIPGYAMAGRVGAMLELNLLAALLALGIYAAARTFQVPNAAALLTWAMFTFASPIVVYSSQIYPEIIGAAAALWAILAFFAFIRTNRVRFLLAAGVLSALNPWLCIRYWMLTAPLLAVIVLYLIVHRKEYAPLPKALAVLLAPLAVSISLFAWFDAVQFGTLMPNAGYLRIVAEQPQFSPRVDIGLLGLFFDRAHGLLLIAPIYVLVIAGLAAMWRERRWEGAALLLTGSTYILFMACSRYWFGGWCPVGRYLVAGIPLLAPLAARVVLNGKRGWITGALALWSLIIALVHTAIPLTRYPSSITQLDRAALAEYLYQHANLDFSFLFPSLMNPGTSDYMLAALWVGVVMGCIFLISPRGRAELAIRTSTRGESLK